MLTLFYLGPGVSIGTIVMVIIVLLITFLSIGMVMYRFIKRILRKKKNKENV